MIKYLILCLLISSNLYADNGFYIKATSSDILKLELAIESRVNSIFIKKSTEEKVAIKKLDSLLNIKSTVRNYDKFNTYTYYIEDIKTGDRYYRIEDLQIKGIKYNFKQFLIDTQSKFQRYHNDSIKQFLPSEGIY